jgi:hypothetical protein
MYLGSKFFKRHEYLKDREIEYPLTPELEANMRTLLLRLDEVKFDWRFNGKINIFYICILGNSSL